MRDNFILQSVKCKCRNKLPEEAVKEGTMGHVKYI